MTTGPFEFTPYRPWPEERRRAARERTIAKGSTWTFERGGLAEVMWEHGATYEMIAAALGVSRNSVAGYIGRQGLTRKQRSSLTQGANSFLHQIVDDSIRSSGPPRLGVRPPMIPLFLLPSPPKLLALPPPNWTRAIPAKLSWDTPWFLEIGGIKVVSEEDEAEVLWLMEGDEIFDIDERKTYCAIHLDMRCFEFERPVTLVPASYYLETGVDWLEIGSLEGEFAETARAYCHTAH